MTSVKIVKESEVCYVLSAVHQRSDRLDFIEGIICTTVKEALAKAHDIFDPETKGLHGSNVETN